MAGNLPESHLAHPLTLLPELSTAREWTAEALVGCATLIHVVLLVREHVRMAVAICTDDQRRRPTGVQPKSLPSLSLPLTPFLVTISIRLLARHLRSVSPATSLQIDHYSSQDRDLARTFFLTGPMWIGWTRPKIKRVCGVLERITLIGLVGDFVEGYLPFVDEYFYCECVCQNELICRYFILIITEEWSASHGVMHVYNAALALARVCRFISTFASLDPSAAICSQ